MTLPTQNRIAHAIAGAATAIYRISIIKRATDSGLAFIQSFGRGDPDDATNQDLVQEMDLDHVQHYGLETHPWVDSDNDVEVEGVVVDADGGEACIAERFDMENLDTHGTADEMPARAKGDTVLYSKDGTYIFLDADGKLTIKAMTDNVEIITEAGKQIILGQGGTTRDIAFAHTAEATSSQVAVAAGLKAYMDKIDVDLAAIKTDMTNIDTLLNAATGTLVANIVALNATVLAAHGGGPYGPPGAKAVTTLTPTTAALAVDTDHSYVSTGSTKAEVEP